MFQIHLQQNQHNKKEIQHFVLFNGKVINNQGKDTDFKWLKAHIAKRATVFEENKALYEATFFYAEFDGKQVVVELGEIQPIQYEEKRKIG